METPLLASQDDDDDDNDGLRPSLAYSSSMIRQDQEESEFSRLIAQRSSFALGGLFADPNAAAEWSHLDASSPFTPSTSRIFSSMTATGKGMKRMTTKTVPVRGEWGVVAASTCFAIFVAFAGATYASGTWTRPLLQVQTPLFNSELKLSNVGLADWISFAMSSSWVVWIIMPIVALVLPCAFLFFAPSWILVDGAPNRVISIERRILHPSFFRSMLELGMRWSFLVIYLTVLQDAIYFKSQWRGSQASLRIVNQHSAGFTAFLLACIGSLGVIIILRSPPRRIAFDPQAAQAEHRTRDTTGCDNSEPLRQSSLSNDASQFQHLRTPPRHAFQHVSSRHMPVPSDRRLDEQDEEEELLVPLEESPPSSLKPQSERHDQCSSPGPPSPGGQASNSSTSTPDLVDEDATGGEGDVQVNLHSRNAMEEATRKRHSLSACRKILLFEVGLVTLVMWMPILYTPWLSLRVETAASESKATLNWSDALFSNVWEQGVQAHTDTWLLVAMAVAVIAQLVVFPILASALGILVWLGEGPWSSKSRQWLYCLQPAMGGVVFSAALLLLLRYQGSVLPPLTDVGATSLGDELASAFAVCDRNSRGDLGACVLKANARILTGGRFYVLHSILLEVFVHLTLKWSLL